MSKLLKSKNLLCIIAFTLFFMLSFPVMINHPAWFDEAHAWMNAKYMNWDNWVYILHSEGHPILWFLLIMPFAKLNIGYPYSIYFINYIFCVTALIIMWRKAPFNIFIKFIITISSIFTCYYGVFARNYTIGLCGLFLAAAYYKKQLKHPLLYAIILSVTLHTHIICAIGAGSLFLIFLYKSLKKDSHITLRTKIISVIIFLASCIFYIYPYFFGFSSEQNCWYAPPGLSTLGFFFSGINILAAVLYLYLFTGILQKSTDKFAKFFISFTIFMMLCLFGFVYSGSSHHYFMFYIYIIITLWICSDSVKIVNNKYFIIAFLLLYTFPISHTIEYLSPKDDYRYFVNYLQTIDLKNKKVFIEGGITPIVPFLYDKTNLYDINTGTEFNWKSYKVPYEDTAVNIINNNIEMFNTGEEIHILLHRDKRDRLDKFLDIMNVHEESNYVMYSVKRKE